MTDTAISHVLQIARLVRDGAKTFQGSGAATFLSEIKGIRQDSPEFYRVVGEIQRQLSDAQTVIENDERMDAEGRNGLIQQIASLKNMFSISGISQNSGNYVQNPDVLVSQFAIIAGFYTSNQSGLASAGSEINELLGEIDKLYGDLSESEEAEEAKAIALDQLKAFRFFLSNVDLLGIDAAYSAYFDLLVRLKRASKKEEKSAQFVTKIWPEVERWAGRLAIIEGILSNSEKLLEYGQDIQRLLGGS